VIEGGSYSMPEESALESRIAELETKLERQGRFTRTITVICTAAILGTLFYIFTQIFMALPGVIVANQMSNLESIVLQWNAIQAKTKQAGGQPAAQESGSAAR